MVDETYSQKPCIHYDTVSHLTSDFNLEIDPNLGYCSLRIFHSTARRNVDTHEILRENPDPSKEQVQELFTESIQAWEESETCKKLRTTLLARKDSLNGKINKIVAFANGSFSLDLMDKSYHRTSFQHAMILTLRDIFAQVDETSGVKCLAQDPAYTDADRAVLQDSDITVVDDPKGFLEVDESTIVTSFAPNVPVKAVISEIARPAVIIWNTVLDEDHDS